MWVGVALVVLSLSVAGGAEASNASVRCSAATASPAVRKRVAMQFELHFKLPGKSIIWTGGHFGRCGDTRWAVASFRIRLGAHRKYSPAQRDALQDGPWAFRGPTALTLRYAGDGVGDSCRSETPPRALLLVWRLRCQGL
jgi:hypothetical protein